MYYIHGILYIIYILKMFKENRLKKVKLESKNRTFKKFLYV